MPNTKKLLSITNLKKYFPIAKSSIFQKEQLYVRANEDISLDIYEGETIGIVGESGCGKSTLLKVLSGFAGNYEGKLSERGSIFWMPQQPYLPKGELIAALTYPQSPETITEQAAQELLSAAHLDHLKEKLYDSGDWSALLSGGEQQMLAMGRALMANPRILLLDEPSMGLSPLLVSEIFDIIQEINKQGVTILLVEQNAKKALSIANRAYVLETGRIVKENDSQALLHDEAIKKAYLGE